jgi:hypothetical protein
LHFQTHLTLFNTGAERRLDSAREHQKASKILSFGVAITAVLSGYYCYHHDLAFTDALASLLKRRSPNRDTVLEAHRGERISVTREEPSVNPPPTKSLHIDGDSDNRITCNRIVSF